MRKLFHFLAILITAVAGALLLSTPAHAADNWSQPIVTLGTSLTDSQKSGTISTLTAPLNGASYNTITVTGDTLVKYLNPSGSSFTSSSGVWSSAAVQKTSSGSGINVQILPYNGKNNITQITADQYKNAALTAGVTDANIYVTSAVPIDGSGALAGVYAAFAQNGDALNQKQVTAAQNEMSTLNDINQANKGKDGYSDAQLNNAVAGAKEEMAQKGTSISTGDITTIVNNQLNKNNLGTIINNNQKQQIINILVEIRNSGALNSSSFKEQASKVMNDIQSNAKGIFDKLNTQENRNLLQKVLDAIGQFFQNVWKQIVNLFK